MVTAAASEAQSSQRRIKGDRSSQVRVESSSLSPRGLGCMQSAGPALPRLRRRNLRARIRSIDLPWARSIRTGREPAPRAQSIGNGTNLTRVAAGFGAERDQLQQPSELIAANGTASDAGNLPPLLRKFVARDSAMREWQYETKNCTSVKTEMPKSRWRSSIGHQHSSSGHSRVLGEPSRMYRSKKLAATWPSGGKCIARRRYSDTYYQRIASCKHTK